MYLLTPYEVPNDGIMMISTTLKDEVSVKDDVDVPDFIST